VLLCCVAASLLLCCKPLQSVANRCKVLQSVAKLHSQVVSLGLLAEVYRRKGESAKAISFYKRACMVPLCGTHRAAVGYHAAVRYRAAVGYRAASRAAQTDTCTHAQTHSHWVHTTGGMGGWALAQLT
jgi:hypothetical protein